MGAIGSAISGTSPTELMKEQQAQYEANFELQTRQAMNDNTNATQTAIANSHAQTAAAATASAREVGQANAHILA